MPKRDPSTSLANISDQEWPFPFPRSDWEQVPVSVQGFVLSLVKHAAVLEAKLSENSQNTSRPPSTDSPYRKPRTKINPDKMKKRGARKGHKGSSQVLLEPTAVVDLQPTPCACGCTNGVNAEPYHIHQQIEVPEIPLDITHFRFFKGHCARCGKKLRAHIGQLSPHQQVGFGPRLTALVGLLGGIVGVSRRDTQQVLHSVFGVPASLGAIQKMIDRTSQAIGPHYHTIGAFVRRALVNYVDETSWRCRGALVWLWVLANRCAAVFQIHPNRNQQAFLSLIGLWAGILVSDDYGCYRDWVNLHQTCLAHLIRRARKLSQASDAAVARFGLQAKNELQFLCRWAKDPPTMPVWKAHSMRVVKLLFAHNERDDEAGIMARALIRQLDNLWIYLEHHAVDPTNNLAERVLRFVVLRRKSTGGTQSEKGNRWMERIATLRETCRLQGRRSFPILAEAIQARYEGRKPDLSWLSSR